MPQPEFDRTQMGELGARYGLEDPDSVPGLCAKHRLDSPALPME